MGDGWAGSAFWPGPPLRVRRQVPAYAYDPGMVSRTLLARGGLAYVDRDDFTRGDALRVVERRRWPSVSLWVEDRTLTFSSRAGSEVRHHAEVTALPHGPVVARHWAFALAVSFESAEREHVLLFWTPRARAVLRELARLGWDADPRADDFVT